MTRPEMAALVRRMHRRIRRRLRRRKMKLRSIPNAHFITIGVITSAVGTAIIMLFVLGSDVITATESIKKPAEIRRV